LTPQLATVLAQVGGAFDRPPIDWHAAAPELTLLAFGALLTLVDIIWVERGRAAVSAIASVGLLATMVPIITLAWDGSDRSMFNGAFVVDDYALIMKTVFVLAGYVVVLLSTNYIAEGDYWENEYYGLLISSILGMILMASARDLITIFVAFELLSIPTYLMATWRKRDLRSNEAGIKYYLMGVFASAVMLYGMSLLFGATGSTLLTEINASLSIGDAPTSVVTLGIIFVIVGFGFKISAVPFHTWAPDTYEGAPTPVTAFLSVASKAAGFVALMNLVFVGFWGRADVYQPVIWLLAAASMTVGNLIALRQTNLVRLLAYSGVAQAGYMLAPLAVAGESVAVADDALTATVTYLAIYTAMNLGAFAVIIAVARRTGSAEVHSYRGLFDYAPGLAVAMTVFLMALAGIPPLGGWFAKLDIMRAVISANTAWGVTLGVVVAVNSVIALYYYSRIALGMWVETAPDDADTSPIRIPVSLTSALVITGVVTLLFGVVPQTVGHFTDVSLMLSSVGG
jgi:NADH-quinone oxidoreductase subunit N